MQKDIISTGGRRGVCSTPPPIGRPPAVGRPSPCRQNDGQTLLTLPCPKLHLRAVNKCVILCAIAPAAFTHMFRKDKKVTPDANFKLWSRKCSVNYRPQTKLWKGNVFTSVSRILSTGGRGLPDPPGQTPPRQTRQTPPLDRLDSHALGSLSTHPWTD